MNSPKSVLYVGLAALVLWGCRPNLTPEGQAIGKLDVPAFPNASLGEGFSLQEIAASPRNFNGWLIVWHKAATRESMAAVIDATVSFHQSYSRHLSYFSKEVAPLRRKIRELSVFLEDLGRRNNEDLRRSRVEEASQWFQQQLGLERLGFDEGDRVAAMKSFGRFCDAKIWEFTLSKENLEKSFAQRPTPAILCENYYKEKGYFDAAASSCGAAAAGSNFFECLWREGFLRTDLAARSHDFQAQLEISVGAMESTLLTRIISQSILRQSRVVRIGERTYDFSFPGLKVISDTTATIDDLAATGILQAFSLQSLNDIASDGSRLVSLGKPRSPEQLVAIEQFRTDLRVLSGSLDDVIFNAAAPTSAGSQGGTLGASAGDNPEKLCAEQGGGLVCDLFKSAPSELGDQMEATRAELMQATAEKTRLVSAADSPCDANNVGDSLRCLRQLTSLRLSEAVTKQGVAVIVLPLQRFGLKFKNFVGVGGESGSMVEMGFGQSLPNTKAVVGCMLADGSAVSCDRAGLSCLFTPEITPLSAHRDGGNSLQLEFWTPPVLADIGLGHQLHNGDSHTPELVELKDEDLAGRLIKTELFPRRWEKVLDVLTGEFSITTVEGQAPDYQGVALLMDSDVSAENVQ